MRGRALMLFLIPALTLVWATDADARRRRRRARKPAVNKQAARAIKALVGKFTFGSRPQKVMNLLAARLSKTYNKAIRKARRQPLEQDRLRKELSLKIRKMKKSFRKFGAGTTMWDSSIIDDQFVKKNGESLVVDIGRQQQRYYFFHNGELYKQFIAFNQDHPAYKGLSFPQFLAVLMKTFGSGKPVFKQNIAGDQVLHHQQWVGGNNVVMQAINKTTIYGNLCLVLIDNNRFAAVDRGRKLVTSTKPAVDPLIDSVIRKDTPDTPPPR